MNSVNPSSSPKSAAMRVSDMGPQALRRFLADALIAAYWPEGR